MFQSRAVQRSPKRTVSLLNPHLAETLAVVAPVTVGSKPFDCRVMHPVKAKLEKLAMEFAAVLLVEGA